MDPALRRELTTEEAAKALDVSERTIYDLRAAGVLRGRQEGGSRGPWFYTLESVREELLRRKGLA